MKWETAKLGDYIDILSGYAFKSRDFIDNGIPVIKIKNITPPNVSLDDLSFVSDETAEKAHKYLLNYNDILIALTGSHINQMASVVGRVARVKYNQPSLLNQRVGKIIANDNSKCDIDYVYYYLSQDDIKIKLATKAGGAANQANISPSDVKALDIPFPEYDTQKMISSILLSYDALVENNQKQIKLLEEAAQRLYKEWFVDLRFPGHETTSIVNGIPEGWKESTFLDVCSKINAGGTPSRRKSEYWKNPSIKWFKTGELFDEWLIDSEEMISEEGLFNSSAKLFPKNTIAMAIYASPTLGRMGIFESTSACNQAMLCMLADERKVTWQWLFFKLYENREKFNAIANGAGQQNISSDTVKNTAIILPPKQIIDLFTNQVKATFDKRLILQKQIKSLIEARDRLLQKLMSGEIEV